MILALTFLSACQEGNKVTAPVFQSNDYIQTVDEKGASHTGFAGIPAWNENVAEPANIFVANDSRNLYVSYYLSNNWQLAGANLSISKSLQSIPVNPEGMPLPEEFMYKATLSRCEQVFTYVIPLAELNLQPGDEFYLVSQALVSGNDPQNNTSLPPYACFPGKGDQEWWQLERGRVNIDPNAPDRNQKINMEQVRGLDKII